MRRVLTIAMLLISINCVAQPKPTDMAIKDTTIRSVSYKIYQGARGGKYYFKTSKSGTIYKVYLKK
jgi:outer membrane lipoprotein-sorting protein